MTANEAREIMIESEQSEMDEVLEELFRMIKESAERGDDYIWYYGDALYDLKNFLIELGYEVEVLNAAYKISWV